MDVAVALEAGAGRDQAAHDDVFLEAAQVIHLAGDGGFGEDARGLLEAGGGDERIRRERRLGDAEKQRAPGCGASTFADDAVVFLAEAELVHLFVEEERGVADVFDLHPAHHLADDGFDVLVVDVDALQAVDLLNGVHEIRLRVLFAQYGEISKGLRKIYVDSEDGRTQKEYSIIRGVHINVQEGEHVKAGEPLIDGPLNPHDLLAVLGEKYTQAYLVNSIQEVYRLQGVNINDKHIETIVRQMMRWVKVEDVGDTGFLLEEQIDKFRFREENDRIIGEGGRPATGRPLLLGITKASLSTDSFISAASFQETTRVLTEAAISGKVDYLRGLKENVIMGRLIPAGTGLERYRNIKLLTELPVEEPQAMEPELTPEEAAALDFLRKDADAVAEG